MTGKDDRREHKNRLRQVKFRHEHAKQVHRWRKGHTICIIAVAFAAVILAALLTTGAQW